MKTNLDTPSWTLSWTFVLFGGKAGNALYKTRVLLVRTEYSLDSSLF